VPTPAISVLIPTYNSQRYLQATVESVLAQTEHDFELVLCDDGSTDATMDMLAVIAESDERVRVHRNEQNLGLHGNLVHLMHLARGAYVKILMADDVLFPDALARLRAPLDEHQSVVLSTSRRIRIDCNGHRIPDNEHMEAPVRVTSVIDGLELGNILLERQVNLVGEPSTAMFRRTDVEPYDMFVLRGVRYGTLLDMVLWIKLLSRGACHYITEPLSCYRQHADQLGLAPSTQIADRTEWMQLMLDAPMLGFLQDPEQEARALNRRIMHVLAQQAADPAAGQQLGLTQVTRLLARLAELHRQRHPLATADAEQARNQIAGDPDAIARQVAISRAAGEIALPGDGGQPAAAETAATPYVPPPTGTVERPTLSVALALVRGGADSVSALRSVRTQTLPGTEVLLLIPGADEPDAQLATFGVATVLRGDSADAEGLWMQALESSNGQVVLFMSDDLELAPLSVSSLVDHVIAAPGTLASPLLVGKHGTGVSSDFGALSTVCLAGQRSALLGEDPLDLVAVRGARATAC
jgi:hypothetical protein